MIRCPICQVENAPGARQCSGCGAGLHYAPTIESSRRVATVLFADMSGFTAMSELLEPDELSDIVSAYYAELANCVEARGGTVVKYIGDEIMALFGAPIAHEDDPQRALFCALEMLDRLHDVNGRMKHRIPHPVGLHAGINTGLVVTGVVGDANYAAFDALGSTVNFAKRLADDAEDGDVFVSASTYRLTLHAFSFRDLPGKRYKGIAEPVTVYALRGIRKGAAPAPRGPKEPPRLVGRDAELATLDAAVTRIERGSGGFVSVSGPAGMGKTRLLHEARAAAAGRVKWVEATCASFGLGGTLGVWAEAMRRLLGAGSGINRRSVSAQLTGGTSIISIDDARDSSAFLAHLLHLDLTPDERLRLSELADEANTHRLARAVRDLIEADAVRQPVALVLDDLHWADTASMRLLGAVLESTTRAPLLVVTAFRTDSAVRRPLEEALAHAKPPFRVDIELQPLAPADSYALAESLVGPSPELEPVRALLVDYAEGNPLFLGEVFQSLQDQRRIELTDGVWRLASDTDHIPLPPTLQQLFVNRIDSLDDTSRRLVQVAAVIGRSFALTLLAEVAGVTGDVAGRMESLERAGFFEERMGPGGADYRFRSALMQEAAYSLLVQRERRDFHRRVAEWYERRRAQPEPLPELAAALVYHWERAEVWPRAGAWALRAADEARLAVAVDEATALYRRAEQFGLRADDADIRRAALHGLGEIAAAGGSELAIEHFGAALALATAPLDRAVLERRIGQTYERMGLRNQALAAFDRAAEALGPEPADEPADHRAERARLHVAWLSVISDAGDRRLQDVLATADRPDLSPADRADALVLAGEIFLRRAAPGNAADQFARALAQARDSGDLPRTVTALAGLARAALARRAFDEARTFMDECLTLRQRLGDQAGAGVLLIELAALDERAGALRDAAARLREAVRLATAADDPVVAAQAHLRLGRVLRVMGDWQGAQAALERAGRDDPEAAGHAALEQALLQVDRSEEPRVALEQTLEEGRRYHKADLVANAHLGLARIARRRRRREEARAHLREVLKGAADPDGAESITARIELAELALTEGQAELAATNARLALEAAQRAGPMTLEWSARRKLGTALSDAGRPNEAEEQFQRATQGTRAAGALPELARCLNEWANMRLRAGGPHDPAARGMLAEMREIVAHLVGANGAER